VCLRYFPGAPLALRHVTFHVKDCEKVAVCWAGACALAAACCGRLATAWQHGSAAAPTIPWQRTHPQTCPPPPQIGVVGRTGSGKTTLLMGLFRLLELAGGRIVVDGHDIATLPLREVRKRISIIPQVRPGAGWGSSAPPSNPSYPATLPPTTSQHPLPPASCRSLCCSRAPCAPTWTPSDRAATTSCGMPWPWCT
jgi:hypothetical protein